MSHSNVVSNVVSILATPLTLLETQSTCAVCCDLATHPATCSNPTNPCVLCEKCVSKHGVVAQQRDGKPGAPLCWACRAAGPLHTITPTPFIHIPGCGTTISATTTDVETHRLNCLPCAVAEMQTYKAMHKNSASTLEQLQQENEKLHNELEIMDVELEQTAEQSDGFIVAWRERAQREESLRLRLQNRNTALEKANAEMLQKMKQVSQEAQALRVEMLRSELYVYCKESTSKNAKNPSRTCEQHDTDNETGDETDDSNVARKLCF